MKLRSPPCGSATVALDLPGAAERLAGAAITATSRAGRTRLSFHLYNTVEDVEMAVVALRQVNSRFIDHLRWQITQLLRFTVRVFTTRLRLPHPLALLPSSYSGYDPER